MHCVRHKTYGSNQTLCTDGTNRLNSSRTSLDSSPFQHNNNKNNTSNNLTRGTWWNLSGMPSEHSRALGSRWDTQDPSTRYSHHAGQLWPEHPQFWSTPKLDMSVVVHRMRHGKPLSVEFEGKLTRWCGAIGLPVLAIRAWTKRSVLVTWLRCYAWAAGCILKIGI